MSRSSRGLPLLIFLLALAALAPPRSACAQEPEPEVILPACGILYPGGYDPNTVGVVEGRVTTVSRPEQGPVTLGLATSRETYVVLAAPVWYWEERKLAVRDGDTVRVKGSKTMGADGNLYLVAQQIEVTGGNEPVILRDARGKPAWSGCGPQGCGKRRR